MTDALLFILLPGFKPPAFFAGPPKTYSAIVVVLVL